MYHLGMDLGGTNIAAAVVTDNGMLLGRVSAPTPRGASLAELAEAVARTGRAAARAAGVPISRIADAGLGTPGAVDPLRGTVVYCSTFDLHGAPLAAAVGARLDLPVALENDANAAACGEAACGAGRGAESMIAVTFGTGIGGGIVLGGRLLTGCNHAGGELGHIVIRQGGKPCACGRRGCYERYASATALIEMTYEQAARHPGTALAALAGAGEITGRTAFDLARAGDPLAIAVRDAYLENVACGLVNLVQIFQPARIVLGGGIAGEGVGLVEPLQQILDREDYARYHTRRTHLTVAALGNDAGIVGAALIRRFQ